MPLILILALIRILTSNATPQTGMFTTIRKLPQRDYPDASSDANEECR